MGPFAFLLHPLKIQDVYQFAPEAREKSPELVRALMERWIPPFPVKRIEVTSTTGKTIEGVLICVPLLPDQFVRSDQHLVQDKILQAGEMAQAMGAKLIGLGGFTGVVGRNGVGFAEQLEVGVTTGNCYAAAVAVESTVAGARSMGISLKEAKLAVVGATGSIGRACSRLLAGQVSRLTLVARHAGSLKALAGELSRERNRSVGVETDIQRAVRDADLVLLATSAPGSILDLQDVKPGSVIVNVAKPDNVDFQQASQRPDVLVVDGGSVLCPGKRLVEVMDHRFPYTEGIDSEKVFSCFAETIILALEGWFEDYSLGRDLELDRIQDVYRLGQRHGFRLTGHPTGGTSYP